MFWIATPVGDPGIDALIVNVTNWFVLGVSSSAVTPTDGIALITVIEVTAVPGSPLVSVAVAVTVYTPACAYVC